MDEAGGLRERRLRGWRGSNRTNSIISAVAIGAVLLSMVGCSVGAPREAAPEASPAIESSRESRAGALLDYVESERATIPQLFEAFPGMYSEIRTEGTFGVQDGSRGLRAGEYAVVWYYYTYAQPMDWGVTMDALDAQRETYDQLCESDIFPKMTAHGVVGPKSVVWSYSDPRSEFGPMWSHACSENG